MKTEVWCNNAAVGFIAAVACVGCSCAEAAGTYLYWEGRTDGTSITNSVDYDDSANWTGDGLGSSSTHYIVQDETTDKPSVNRFVRMSGETSVYGLSGGTTSWLDELDDTMPRTAIVRDGKLTPTGKGGFGRALMLYCDVELPSEAYYFNNSLVCGDISGSWIVVNAGLCQRLDLYAKSAGGVRTYNKLISSLTVNYGDGFCIVAPRSSSSAIEATFTAVKDSPFLMPSDTSRGTDLPIGTTVADKLGTLPEGTFLKRIFLDGSIELSEVMSVNGPVELTFAPQSVDVSYTIQTLYSGSGGNGLRPMKYSPVDKMKITVNSFNPGSAAAADKDVTFDCYEGYYPGTVKLAWNPGGNYKVVLGDCHMEMTSTGLANCRVYMKDAAKTARITVPADITAPMTNMSAIIGTVIKDGDGALWAGLTRDRMSNTGCLTVEAGTLELESGSYVATLAVSNGAVLKLNGDVEAGEIVFEPGAAVEGEGLVVLTGPLVVPPAGVTFADGTGMRLKGGSGEVFESAPTSTPADLPVVPAFWVDVSKTSSMVCESENGTNFVTRINDVRKTSEADDYLFATNIVLRPWIESDRTGGGNAHIRIAHAGSSVPPESSRELVWSRPVTGIRAVFIAHCIADGGGQVLGMTPSLAESLEEGERDPFHRLEAHSWVYGVVNGHSVPENGARAAVIAGSCYHNGESRSATERYPYSGEEIKTGSGGSICYYPVTVSDFHPVRGVAADCFAYQGGEGRLNGYKRFHEILVYTNELTAAQRIAVENYLMKRWMNVGVNCPRVAGDSAKVVSSAGAEMLSAFVQHSGETLAVGTLAGGGEYVKRGAGKVYFEELADGNASVLVSEGVLTVRSVSADDVSLLPEGAYLHLDATRTGDMTFAEGADNELTGWKSVGSDLAMVPVNADTECRPVLREGAFNGKNLVDFGGPRFMSTTAAAPGMKFEANSRIRTVVMVQDSSLGGGSIVGQRESWMLCGLMRGNWLANRNDDPSLVASDPLVASRGNNYSGIYGILNDGGKHAYRATLNGRSIDVHTEGFSGGNDLVSFVSCQRLYVDSISHDYGSAYAVGGQRLGEYLLYERGLDSFEIKDVEAYLRKKWFGEDMPGYKVASVVGVKVDAGAVLEITGNAPLRAEKLSVGGGSVIGSLALADDAELEVPVLADGSVATLTVSESLDMSKGGTVVLTGVPEALEPGEYVLVRGGMVSISDMSLWSVRGCPGSRLSYALVFAVGELRLRVTPPGMTIVIR